MTKQLLQEVFVLLKKDIRLEWRQKYALNGILLYVASTTMLIYMAFMQIDDRTWITLFWIVLLFAAVNAVAKSFVQESQARHWYYYTLTSPQAVILSKIIYNIGLLVILSLVTWLCYALILGNPIENVGAFGLTVFLGAMAFSLCFTLIAAIAAQAGNSATLMPVLSFPIVIPILGLLLRLSKSAWVGFDDALFNDLAILLAIDGILIVLSYILFPYLWKD